MIKLIYIVSMVLCCSNLSNAQAVKKIDASPHVTVPAVEKPLKLDGKGGDPAWAQSLQIELQDFLLPANPKRPARTRVSLLHDSQNLYIAFDCEDDQVVATRTEAEDQTFRDDCVEILIGAADVRLSDSVCLEINARGTLADYYYRHADWMNYRFTSQARIVTSRQNRLGKPGFRVEIAIPYCRLIPAMRYLANEQMVMPTQIRANFARWDRGGKNRFSIWSDSNFNLPHPHNPGRYGWLTLAPLQSR